MAPAFAGVQVQRLKDLVIGSPLELPLRRVKRRFEGPSPLDDPYDQETVAVMRRAMGRRSNGIDVGAHAGVFTDHLVRVAPKGRHVAFEPIPALAERLARRFPEARVHQVALGDETAVVQFRHVTHDPAYSGFSRRPWDTYDEGSVNMIPVSVRRLDDVVDPAVPVHFVKVDVEGSELALFRGAMATLQRWRPVIAFELSMDPATNYDLLTESAGLRISLMSEWLEDRHSLERDQFLDEALGGHHYMFVAHP